jgi:hypothetical protein
MRGDASFRSTNHELNQPSDHLDAGTAPTTDASKEGDSTPSVASYRKKPGPIYAAMMTFSARVSAARPNVS